MTYTQGTSHPSASESVSYVAVSYVHTLPVIEESVLSDEDRKKLEYALRKHKRGLELLSQ